MIGPRHAARAVLVAVAIAALVRGAAAHSGLRFSSPLDGSTLGASPTHIRLTFIERPEPSLATIRVSDINGQTYQNGQPELVGDDPLTLAIAVSELPRGVYVVNWRVVSAVDGHATAGAFAFGVQMEPTGPAPTAEAQSANPSIEIAGRAVFLLGLMAAIGAATYRILRLGNAPWIRIAGAALLLATAGLAVLIAAQWRAGDRDLPALLETSIGRAWIARAVAIGVAVIGLAMAAAGSRQQAVQPLGAVVVWLAGCGAIAVHALSGHAAAGRLPVASTVIVHAIHVVAAGMWIGALGILIAGLRSSVPGAETRRLARFSMLAAVGLILVTITGVARSVHEVGAWDQLPGTAYGAFVIGKVLLLLAIAGLGAMNRWRHLPAVHTTTQPLRRAALGEVALAVLAIVIAGALSTLPPPAAANVLPGIEASGADFATTVKATLTAVSDQPGPNRFSVAVEDYDSGESIAPDRVSLRFTPIDDAGVAPTTLALSRDPAGGFTGTGAQLSFDGRWRVDVLIERGANAVGVPLEIEARGPPQRITARRSHNAPSTYRVQVGAGQLLQMIVEKEQLGATHLQISCFNAVTEPCGIRDLVVTAAAESAPVQSLPITRQDRNRFTAPVYLERGRNRIAIIMRTDDDSRRRAVFEVVLPR